MSHYRISSASFRSISSAGECPYANQPKATAKATEFPWTVALPVEPTYSGSCPTGAEDAFQMKTEVLEDECELECAMPGPSKAAHLTSKSEIEAANEEKTDNNTATVARNCDYGPASTSDPSQPLRCAEDRGE